MERVEIKYRQPLELYLFSVIPIQSAHALIQTNEMNYFPFGQNVAYNKIWKIVILA